MDSSTSVDSRETKEEGSEEEEEEETEEEEEEDKKSDKHVHENLEPGIIDDDMIGATVLEGYTGEAGRLARLEKIDLGAVTVLRLEFQSKFRMELIEFFFVTRRKTFLDILKIDHLWVMPSLKILSLAFNKIEKIENLDMLSNLLELNLSFNFLQKVENLDKLSRLEILSLYGNKIEKLENVDNLENLLIFSIGENKIETYEGVRVGIHFFFNFSRTFLD